MSKKPKSTDLPLKPCPFCGSDWLFTESRMVWGNDLGLHPQYRIACCVKQHDWFRTRHAAIMQWNKRHNAGEWTSSVVAEKAAKVLRSKTARKDEKAIAASALTQKKMTK